MKPAIHVTQVAEADFPTRWGSFRIFGFEGRSSGFEGRPAGSENRPSGSSSSASESPAVGSNASIRPTPLDTAIALVMGDLKSMRDPKAAGDPKAPAPLVRIHSQCLTGDVFASLRCDCRQQLELALKMISDAGAGILIYEQQEGRGIGLMAKLQAYQLQDQGRDTVQANEDLGFAADQRLFAMPGEILRALGIKRVRLLSNNPDKVAALTAAGIEVVERLPCEVPPHASSEQYLKTKKEKMGHLLG